MTIDRFTGKYRFLSNFYPSKVTMDGLEYPTVEAAFQAAKTSVPEERAAIAACPTPGHAKRMGRTVTLRPDWESVKTDIMGGLVRQKFAGHPELAALLLKTDDAALVEGNDWGDTCWGMVRTKAGWVGENRLGKILMQIREELRKSAV